MYVFILESTLEWFQINFKHHRSVFKDRLLVVKHRGVTFRRRQFPIGLCCYHESINIRPRARQDVSTWLARNEYLSGTFLSFPTPWGVYHDLWRAIVKSMSICTLLCTARVVFTWCFAVIVCLLMQHQTVVGNCAFRLSPRHWIPNNVEVLLINCLLVSDDTDHLSAIPNDLCANLD